MRIRRTITKQEEYGEQGKQGEQENQEEQEELRWSNVAKSLIHLVIVAITSGSSLSRRFTRYRWNDRTRRHTAECIAQEVDITSVFLKLVRAGRHEGSRACTSGSQGLPRRLPPGLRV